MSKKLFLIFFVALVSVFVVPGFAHAATRYWVGGGSSSNWSATGNTNWSASSGGANNASVPGSSDDVIFDGAGATGNTNSTISAGISVKSVTITSGYTHTLTHSSAVTLTITGNTFNLGGGLGFSYALGSATTSALSFTSTTGTLGTPTAITSNGQTFGNTTISGIGGYFSLQDNMLLGSAAKLSLSGGTFDANGHNVSIGLFSSIGGTVKTLTMGSGTWTITGNAATILQISGTLTLNRGNPFNCNYSGSVGTRTITDLIAGDTRAIDVNITAGSDTIAPTTYFNNVDFTGFTGTLDTSTSGMNVYGNMIFSSGMTIPDSGGYEIDFYGVSGTKTITTNGAAINLAFGFYNSGGSTYQLTDDLTMASDSSIFLVAAGSAFSANNKNITTGIVDVASGTTLTMGSGTWTISGNSTNVWHENDGGAATINYQTSTVKFTGTNQRIAGSNDFYNFTKDISAGSADVMWFDGTYTQTIHGNLTLTGASGKILTLRSFSSATNLETDGVQWKLVAGAGQSVSYVDVKDSDASGGTVISQSHSVDSGNNLNWLFNTAPTFTTGPFDGNSSSTTPTSAGANVLFTATATDAQSDQYYLAICKTNAITAVNSSAPTCGGGHWCISSSTASGSQASCTYGSTNGDDTQTWYAFVCDNNSSSQCSSASQGSGDAGSPFVIASAGTGGGSYYAPAAASISPAPLVTSPVTVTTPPPVVPPTPPTPPSTTTTTQTSSSTPSTATLPRYLGPSDHGSDVLALQHTLQSLGFLPTTITPNGHFGPATTTAIKKFQKAHGIRPTGNVGPVTLKALNSL